MGGIPLIGLVADRKPCTSGAWVDVLTDGIPHSYLTAIEQAGGAPLLFPSLEVYLDHPEWLLDRVDGFFMPGGRDLDASLYGQAAHAANDTPLRIRDELEIRLVREARRRGMPILGACRGMQVLNVALGGTLIQHIDDVQEMKPHRDVVGAFTSHPVEVKESTLLADIVGCVSFDIASHHHQGVDALGRGLITSAVAPDGMVEAVEARSGSFCLGVQWHPEERLEPMGHALMVAFVSAAARQSRE